MQLPDLNRIINGGAAEPAPSGGFASGGAVLVTGAPTGIGAAIATDLAGRGVTVLAGVRNAGDAPTADGMARPRRPPVPVRLCSGQAWPHGLC